MNKSLRKYRAQNMYLPYNWTNNGRVELRTASSICALCYKDFIRSKLLLSNEMRTATKGEDVFELVDMITFLKKMVLMEQASRLHN